MLASLKRNQPATQPLSRLDHRRFAKTQLWQETDVRMDAGNTTAAGTRKHAPAKQECRGWKGGALWHVKFG